LEAFPCLRRQAVSSGGRSRTSAVDEAQEEMATIAI
jgi:hypothetical protein